MKFQAGIAAISGALSLSALCLSGPAHAGTYEKASEGCFPRYAAVTAGKADLSDAMNAFCAGVVAQARDHDDAAAHVLFMKAAEAGNVLGQYSVGRDFDEGKGVAADVNQALAWYLKAAEQDLADAQNDYGYIYFYGKKGIERDEEKAVPWFRKAAGQGYTHSMTLLAEAYYKGRGVDKDLDEAFRLYTQAAGLGHRYAEYMLGTMYLDGKGTPVDRDAAKTWLTKAAEDGIGLAQGELAGMATEAKDPVTALMWYDIRMAGKKASSEERDALVASLTAEQVAEAQARADAWLKLHPDPDA